MALKLTPTDLDLLVEVRRMAKDGRARRIRAAADLSQHEIGSACGVSTAAVSRWELGQRVPRTETGLRYAHLLAGLEREVERAAG